MTIQQILREKNLSRYQLSKKSGVPWATLADICSGKTTLSRCSAGTLMKLSSTLDIPMEQLITLTVEKPQMHGGKPTDRTYLEKDLPASLDRALREYIQGETDKVSYDGTDRSRIPDKIALVSVTVSQQNSSAEGFPLTELSLYTTDMLMNMDWDLLGVVNPILDGATGIRLQDGASCDILLPFDLYRYRFTSSEWNGLEQSSIWLQVTNYPTRKIIQVNIGEE